MDKNKAKDLITQFEQHQQGQIQCLQALLGLASEDKDEANGKPNLQEGLTVSTYS